MKEYTLVIMAAGLGSRFGGLKQMEPVGPNGEFIMDYSVYDAKRAGFNKVVFIIKKDFYQEFKDTVIKRIEGKIEVDVAFQELDNVPSEYRGLDRIKPWGTAHAILCAKDKIDTPFLVINADDFYGYNAYSEAIKFFENNESEDNFGLISYKIKNTLTENGAVKRGVALEEDGYLTSIIESSVLEKDGKIIATPLDGSPIFEIEGDRLVSMNCFALNPYIFSELEKGFVRYLEEHKDDINKGEYLLPDLIFYGIQNNIWKVEVLSTDSKWAGVTYKEDKEGVVNYINELIENGEYPKELWK